jgi:hypothetical protein
MTGDLSEPAQRAAQQTYEAAARLDEQAAAELDRAAAHCRVAATHFQGAEVPRGAAHAWAALGISARQNCGWRNRLVPTASRRASRACVEDHLRAVTGGTDGSRCRGLGSPQSSREVPAETQRSPPEPARGMGTQRKDRCSGVRRPRGVAGNRGPVWPLEVPLRDAVAHRLRPVGISAQARSVMAGAGLGLSRPGTLMGRPSPNEPAAVVHRRSVKGKLAALVPSGPLTLGRWCARRSSRARASCWLASRAVLGR